MKTFCSILCTSILFEVQLINVDFVFDLKSWVVWKIIWLFFWPCGGCQKLGRDFEYFACCKTDPLKVSDTDLVNFVLIYFTERLPWTYWEKETRLRWVLHLLILPSRFPYISSNVSFENLVLHKIDYFLLLLLFSLFSSPLCSTIS